MIVHITREGGYVSALGHRVALHLGGEAELKRRCLASMGQLNDPPDEVRFERPGAAAAPPPLPPPLPAAAPPGNSSAPVKSAEAPRPAPPRSHKRRS